MVFKVSNTFSSPGTSQAGFPSPGSREQFSGAKPITRSQQTGWFARHPTRGKKTFLRPAEGSNAQRGFPSPLDPSQKYPPGTMNNRPIPFGGAYMVETPYYDRGAAAFVPNFGIVTTNPIGAGIPVNHRPQSSYGPAGQYINGAIWWTSQVIPTTVNLSGLTSPEVMGAILSQEQVYGVVRVAP